MHDPNCNINAHSMSPLAPDSVATMSDKSLWNSSSLKEHPPWGRSQHSEVCTGGILLYQFTPPSWTWRKVMYGYNRNIFSVLKHHIRLCRAFCNFGTTHCSKHAQFALVRMIRNLLGSMFYNICNFIKTRPHASELSGPMIKWKQSEISQETMGAIHWHPVGR